MYLGVAQEGTNEMAGTESGSISIGSIIAESFAVIVRHPVVILGSGALFYALPSAAWGYVARFLVPQPGPGHAMSFGGVTLLAMVVLLVLQAFVHIVVLRVVSEDRRGGAVDVAAVFGTAARLALPLSVLYVLMYLGIVAASLLVVVPGIILMLMWTVAGPALVQEGTGIGGAFGRSRALTKGHRWKIFALLLVAGVAVLVVMSVISLLTAGTVSFLRLAALGAARQLPIGYSIASAIMGIVIISFFAAIYSNLYFALREAQEGPEVGALAEIFA
jgi:hypothetical protein